MAGKTASRKTRKSIIEVDEKPEYECEDCFSEALMYCGILDDLDEPPANQLEQFNRSYREEFYHNHVDPKGWRSPIKPRRIA